MVFRIFHFQATGSNQNQITVTENPSSCAAAPDEWLPATQVQVAPFCSFLGWISSLAGTGTSLSVMSSCTPGTSTSPAILSCSIPMGLVPCQPSALSACCTTQGCHQMWLQLLLAQVPGQLNTLFGNCSLRRCSEAILPCKKHRIVFSPWTLHLCLVSASTNTPDLPQDLLASTNTPDPPQHLLASTSTGRVGLRNRCQLTCVNGLLDGHEAYR